MSLDAIMLRAVVDECRPLVGSKMIAIDQYGPAEVGISLIGPAGRDTLIISVQPEYARLYRTASSRGSVGASAFVTALRDRLLGGTAISIDAVPEERIAVIRCSIATPAGFQSYRLIAELIGRQSLLVLVNEEDGRIVETLRRVRTAARDLSSGERYEPPARLDKVSLAAMRVEDLAEVATADSPEQLVKRLVNRVGGMSPSVAREVVARAGLSDAETLARLSPDERQARLWSSVTELIDRVQTGDWTPMIGLDTAGRPSVLSAIPIASLPPGRVIVCATMSEAIQRFYVARLEIDRLRQRTVQLRRVLADEVTRLERLVVNLTSDLAVTEREDEFRKYGELLTAHLSVLRRGQSEAVIPDLYDPAQRMIHIPLAPTLSPAENAKSYFKRAKKARDGRAIIEQRLGQARERLERGRALRKEMEGEPGTGVVERTHRECVRLRLIREQRDTARSSAATKRKATEIHPRRFLTSDGWLVLVGRNDRENETLTKTAAPDDLWFHARGIGGSHVILRREGKKEMPSKYACYEAASVAAYFSKARGSTTVPVDYTERRYVRKQKNGRPGQVVFTQEKTLFVEPKLLREQESLRSAHA